MRGGDYMGQFFGVLRVNRNSRSFFVDYIGVGVEELGIVCTFGVLYGL